VAAAAALLAAGSAGATQPLRPLETAIVDPSVFTGGDAAAGFERVRAAGAAAVKIPLFWNEVAPLRRPVGFDATDPRSPAYDWTSLDAQVRLARAHGLEPLIYISSAPSWAMRNTGGVVRPDPLAYSAFALAAVRRYSGASGLPRVRYWQAWNEPNKVAGREQKPGTVSWYRALVNAFAAEVHTVPGNRVIAGGLAPFGISTSIAPLVFMRRLLCLSGDDVTAAECRSGIHFDIWSTDPYTAGGPDHEAAHPGDASVAELPEMRALLNAAVRSGVVVSKAPVRFWVTEFSWDSDPPDPAGVPAALEGRWVSEALYRMWSAGVSLVTWFTLRDQPFATSPYQSGLYYRGASFDRDRPKPALAAFRFPFVAYPGAGGIDVWGRTPGGAAGAVVVEQHGASGWKRVRVLRADAAGIFQARVGARGTGPLRARVASSGSVSLPFGLVEPPDRPFQPFGAPVPAPAGSSSAAVSQYVETVPPAAGVADGSRTSTVRVTVLGALGDAASADARRAIGLGLVLLASALALAALARRRRRVLGQGGLVAAAVGVGVFAFAYDGGGYSSSTWSTVAVALWWTILAGIVLRVWPLEPVPRAAVAVAALLALFACWDIVSAAWAANAEGAFAELDRSALYLAVFALAVVASERRQLERWIDGLTAGIVAIAVVALVSRLDPGSFPGRGLPAALPGSSARLSFPLGYWNGLGTFVAMGFPLLLYVALAGGRVRRVLALGALPALGAVVYLTSSRGAVLAALSGVAVFVLCGLRRARRVHRGVAVALAACALLALAPAAYSLRDFTQPPATAGEAAPATLTDHLLSGSGSGRWQFWAAALGEFRRSPLHGGGAGSYEAWWAQHGSLRYFVRDAHSLPLQTLAELGIIGFALLAAAFAIAAATGARHLRSSVGAARAPVAALLAVVTAYLVGAAIDWMWELPAVTAVGFVALGLLAGPATGAPGHERVVRRGRVLALATASAACVFIVAEAILLVAGAETHRSQAEARAGRLGPARSHALAAARLEPWAASPYYQLALVDDGAGDLLGARRAILSSLARNRSDWQAWLVAGRIEARLGASTSAARSLARARTLNPRSPIVSTGK
jgi:hypothetical protein